jgi:integrase
VKIDYPGLLKEPLPSGKWRYRVRVQGKKAQRIPLSVTPDHPNFREHYYAARQGIRMAPEPISEATTALHGSMGWLIEQYTEAMKNMAKIGNLSPLTVKQRRNFLDWMRAEVGEFSMHIPSSKLIRLRDKKINTPGAADNFVKTVRAMYAWAIKRGMTKENPAANIERLNTNGKGARAWSLTDLDAYRKYHPPGTTAHLALTLFMFTAGRIGDVYRLGPANEVIRDGETWLAWKPSKKGSAPVEIPILPPLQRAIAARNSIASTYLTTDQGQPFASKEAFANKFRDWIDAAGLGPDAANARKGLSSHGIRKAAGELLAMSGATQYHIMSVHGHTSAKTSEIYTRGAERAKLAGQAMEKLRQLEW